MAYLRQEKRAGFSFLLPGFSLVWAWCGFRFGVAGNGDDMAARLFAIVCCAWFCAYLPEARAEVLVVDPIVRGEVTRALSGQLTLDKKQGFKVYKAEGATALKAIINDEGEWPANRGRAIEALARDFQNPETFAFLSALLSNRSDAAAFLKRRMLDALSANFKAEAPPVLEKALSEADILVRESAILGLVATLGAKAKPLLSAQQEHEKEPYLQRLLAKLLKKLS